MAEIKATRVKFTCLNGAIGLIVTWLCVESISLIFAAESQALFRYLHFILVLLLAVLALICKRVWKSEQTAHQGEVEEMRQEAGKSALRYKNLLDGAGDAIFVVNAETGRLEEMNDMGTVLLGYRSDELAAFAGKDLIPEQDQARFDSLVRRLNRCGTASTDCLTFKRKDGTHLLGEVNARLIDLGSGGVVQAIVRDITQRTHAEQEMRKRNRKLSILNSIIARANASLDLHTVLTVTLQETMEVYGAEGGAIHILDNGRMLTLAARKNLPDRLVHVTRQTDTASDSSCRITTTRQCASLSALSRSACCMAWHAREEGWHGIAGIPLFAKNQLIGVMHMMTRAERCYAPDDVNFFTTMGNQIGIVIEHARLFAELNWKTAELLRSYRLMEKNSRQLALSENRLRKNLALVEHATLERHKFDRMKSQFLGMISHEFRTPLTAILCSADHLLANSGKDLADDDRRLLDIIHKGGTILNGIISDLLEVVRLEAKVPPVNKTVLHLTDIVNDLMEQFGPVLHERSQQITFQGIEALPHFSGDRECLFDIFARLLENAVKFTPDGGDILLSAKLTDGPALNEKSALLAEFNPAFFSQMGNGGYLQVEVRDSGVGIAPEERHNIFDTFYEIGDIRHHTSGKSKFQGKGAGLGLAIVKGLVEAHGGMVWVESPISGSPELLGSSFFVLFPLEEELNQSVFSFMQTGPELPERDIIDKHHDERSDSP